MLENYPDLLTPNDVMEILGVHKSMVYRLLRNGDIPATHIGTRIWRIRKNDLIAYIAAEN